MRGGQGRADDAQNVISDQTDAKSEQRGGRVTQAVDFAVQCRGQFAEGGFQLPTSAISLRDPCGFHAVRRGLEPETFNRFRNYLCGYSVCGKDASGLNAANLRSNFSQDLLFGLANDEYLSRVFERLDFLTPMDRSIVMGDAILPSVVDRLLERLETNRSDVLRIETSNLAERIATQSDGFRRAVVGYKRFYQALCKLSAMHWQSIVVILIKPFEGLTPEELSKLPVKPTESVGHAGHERPESIFKMRRENPVVHKLLDGFDLAVKTNGCGLHR